MKIPIFLDSEPASDLLWWKNHEITTVILSPLETREIKLDIQTVGKIWPQIKHQKQGPNLLM